MSPTSVNMQFHGTNILEHEDGGMMATIRVNPAPAQPGRK